MADSDADLDAIVQSSIAHDTERLVSSSKACKDCGTTDENSFDPRFRKHFGIAVCYHCRKRAPEEYALMTKTKAKEEFLLTDADFADLRHVDVPNARHASWGDMKLYARGDLRRASLQIFGDEAGLHEERLRRETSRVVRASNMIRNKRVLGSAGRKLLSEAAVAELTRSKTETANPQSATRLAPLRSEIDELRRELGHAEAASSATTTATPPATSGTLVKMKAKKALEPSKREAEAASKRVKVNPVAPHAHRFVESREETTEDGGIVTVDVCSICGLESRTESL